MKNKPDLPLALAPVPAVATHKPRKRKIHRNASGDVLRAIGPIEPGCEIFCLTNGQFSMIDILDHVLTYTGRATIDLATWTAADGDLRRAHAFMLDGRIERIRLIVDPSFRSRKPEFCAVMRDIFGDQAIRTIPLHGKFACIRSDGWNIAIRSSMNLNPNHRIESVEISDDPELAQFFTQFTDEVFSRSADANFTSQSKDINAKHDMKTRLAF